MLPSSSENGSDGYSPIARTDYRNMGTVRTFNGIFALLSLQLVLLVLIASESTIFGSAGASIFARPAGLVEHLTMVAVILVLLWLAWSALLEPVEIYWGTSAIVRFRSWMLPALTIAAALIIGIAALVLVSRRASLGGVRLFTLAEISLLLPISVTAIMIVSAVRRRTSIRAGIGKMREALEAAGPETNLDRIEASIDWEGGASTISVRANPQGFTFAGLSSKPWHDPSEFAWIPRFVSAVDMLRAEAEAVLAGHGDRIEQYHYVGLDGKFWQNFSFVKRHEEITENLALCPVVAGLLRTVPGYPAFRDAMFSIIAPHGVIRRHRDVSNVFLTLHLPLVVPQGGYIEVGGMRREWRYGEPLIFDSSYVHEAVNPADEPRVVLLVDFPHPDLTNVEREWVRAARI
jgi:beta-hydroxylase